MRSILIIGCGSIGERHLRCFQKTGRAQLSACDANATLLQTVARTYQVPAWSSWQEALDQGRFDAAVVCTPAHLHVPIAQRALERGCHVLIEKPLSVSMAGIEELRQAQRTTGRQAAVAYVYHVYPLLTQARDFLRGGALGPVLQVTLVSGQHFPAMRPPHAAPFAQTYYRDRALGGGAIQDALTHMANWVESVIGPTESVMCDCAHQVLEGVTVEDTVHISARHGGALVNYSLNQFQAPNESTLQFNTAQGSVKIELHAARWGVCRLGEKAWTWHEVTPPERDTPFTLQAGYFLDQLDGQPSKLCSLDAAISTLRFNLASLQSSETGARVVCAHIR